ncbi:MAG: hypothetical protein HYW45_02990 [Candidatus Daviesbacteria bacterium]|nr:MAG: hypothetical protein HYW45_02990 [Candidatus Daviesbacteria bacterium]
MNKSKRSLGLGFKDQIEKITRQSKQSFSAGKIKTYELDDSWKDLFLVNFQPPQHDPDLIERSWRPVVFLSLTLILFFILFLRLFHLQVVEGGANRELANSNRVQIKVIHSPRGIIYDRNGKILAANSPGFRLVDTKSKKATILTRDEALALEVSSDPRADSLEIDSIRSYSYKETAAHLLGYVGQISPDQLKSPRFADYKITDRVGQAGLESYYESLLRGKDGGEIIEVDSLGRKLRTIRTVAPLPGQDLHLTIDIDLQTVTSHKLKEAAAKAGSCCGAVVVEDPQTGQILSLVSWPSYDNNLFTTGTNDQAIGELLTRSDSPILNRAIGGTYPPGSTFKIITSIAALTSGKITPQTSFEDTGEIYLGAFKFTNWYFTQYGKTEGPLNLVKALQRSNDIYFYRAGQVLGEKPIIEWARKLRLGGKLGIDLPGEVNGLVPDENWKKSVVGEVWFPGDTLHLAIGQGYLLTTPLQVLGFSSYVANNGNLMQPKLLLNNFKPVSLVNEQVRGFATKIISPEQLKTIQTGLSLVPKDGGTAWPFFSFPIPTAGKTGTAEFGDAKGRTHAWYTAYGPLPNPKIAATVLVEAAGEGSSIAAPIVKEIFRWYFSPDKNKLILDQYAVATESARTLGE